MRNSFLLLLGLTLAACGAAKDEATATVAATDDQSVEMATVNTETSASYLDASAAAAAAIQLATDKGHAWNTFDKLINDAAAAAESGDEAGAIALADEARIQADLAVMQADREVTAWRDNVISD